MSECMIGMPTFTSLESFRNTRTTLLPSLLIRRVKNKGEVSCHGVLGWPLGMALLGDGPTG